MLLDIRNVRFANESNFTFFMLQNPQCIKINYDYNMLKFNMPDTNAGPWFIDLNICCVS